MQNKKDYANQPNETYVEVLLPLPLSATFTYRIPSHDNTEVGIGYRVIVPFGRKKFYTGIVISRPISIPTGMEIKDVAMILDNAPIIRHPQIKFWEWLAEYYLCACGDVYKAAVPAGLKLESETFVELNPDFDLSVDTGNTPSSLETSIMQLLDHYGALSVSGLSAKLEGTRGVTSTVNRMIEKGILIISEKLVERYRPRYETYVEFTIHKDDLEEAFARVKGAKKQEHLLLAMLEMSGFSRGNITDVRKEDLLKRADVAPAILSAVVKKGILQTFRKEINRFRYTGSTVDKLPDLSQAQNIALDQIHRSWLDRNVTLLHGVTSSGKTEIYIHLIDYVLKRGDQCLMLVPEIALTTQLTRRLQIVFGDKVIIYHSRFTDNERVDIWKKLLTDNSPRVIIGARSAVFLPFSHLGLVIVDEEHDASYKQFDPAPRYNGRDAAIVLASMHGAKTLLGSATPAIDTYHKAITGKFGLVKLTERYGDVELPDIRIIDMKQAIRSKTVKGTFAYDTERIANDALNHDGQVIFFQNRRGYAPLARCKQCAWVPKCEHCDVALTYHANIRQLQCHYCGSMYPLPNVCPQCKEPSIEIIGYGTERVEEEVERIFPGRKMLRMDLDTTRNKNAYEQIIDDFSEKKADILVGTQMVTKGLDFGGVEMVGVLNADALINFPDFRSSERAFNMLEQVAGRSGRRSGSKGMVVIQTYQPSHHVLAYVKSHNYDGFYDHEIVQRHNFFYPPFTRVIYMYIKHRDPAKLRQISDEYAVKLRRLFGGRVFGPEEPSVGRVQGLYIRKIMLKIETGASMAKVKELLRDTYISMHSLPQMKGVTVYYDVDPY
ncbi:MAG: primosomal protein N' [Bacteroidales bacterium]|nr:primosomal protein N' [Bacteroidales bacterium]